MAILTLDILQKQWPHGDQHVPGLMEGIVNASDAVFTKYNMNTPLLIAHFMAQASEECGEGREVWENMDYTATRLRQVFPTHFTPRMAADAAHNPRRIADIAYGGRKELGNATPPSDDGWNFRGRGLSQVTGREGYQKLQNALHEHGLDLNIMEEPDLVCEPAHTLECGVLDFILCGCLPYAEKDDVLGVTKKLNGGTNGIQERRRQLRLWKKALNVA